MNRDGEGYVPLLLSVIAAVVCGLLGLPGAIGCAATMATAFGVAWLLCRLDGLESDAYGWAAVTWALLAIAFAGCYLAVGPVAPMWILL